MKTTFILLCCVLLFFGCSDDDKKNNTASLGMPAISEIPEHIIEIPADLSNYTAVDVDYNGDMVDGYSLSQFITVNPPELFCYHLVSNDDDGNWSPRSKDLADMNWEDFQTGYLLPSKSNRTYFPSDEIETTYNVKFMGYIKLYRAIDVFRQGTLIRIYKNSLDFETLTYNGTETAEAVKLSTFISEFVTVNAEGFNYILDFADRSEATMNWSELQNSYIIEDSEVVLKLDNNNISLEQYSNLRTITLSEIAVY